MGDRSHRGVGHDRSPVARRDRDRERIRPGERSAAVRMREPTRRRRGQHRDEPALGKPSPPVSEHARREAAPRDDHACALRWIGKRGAHDLLEHEVAERTVTVPALEALLRLDQERPSCVDRGRASRARPPARARARSSRGCPHTRSARAVLRRQAVRAPALQPPTCVGGGHGVANARWLKRRTGQPRLPPCRRSSRSGLTATGWPTAARNGTSEHESEYAVELSSSSCPSRRAPPARRPSPDRTDGARARRCRCRHAPPHARR